MDIGVLGSLAVGLALLLIGGDGLVRGAVSIAERMGLSPAVIGLTLVGFGTSAPELVTSLEAALVGAPGIAVGNVVGSNIANILLILGLSAAIVPVAAPRGVLVRDGAAMAGAALLMAPACLYGALPVWAGMLFVALLVAFLIASIRADRRRQDSAAALHEAEVMLAPSPASGNLIIAILFFALGLGAVILGADLLVDSAVILARDFGVSETVIGLTIVAVGTSLPELATSMVAALRGRADVALGNVLGSNIFNVLGILGVTAAVGELPIPEAVARFDLWAMLGATALLLVLAWTGQRISRVEGALLLVLYVAYTAAVSLPAARAFFVGG